MDIVTIVYHVFDDIVYNLSTKDPARNAQAREAGQVAATKLAFRDSPQKNIGASATTNPARQRETAVAQRGSAGTASNIDAVKRYIRNQEIHHRKMSFEEELVALLKKHGVEFDPKEIFD